MSHGLTDQTYRHLDIYLGQYVLKPLTRIRGHESIADCLKRLFDISSPHCGFSEAQPPATSRWPRFLLHRWGFEFATSQMKRRTKIMTRLKKKRKNTKIARKRTPIKWSPIRNFGGSVSQGYKTQSRAQKVSLHHGLTFWTSLGCTISRIATFSAKSQPFSAATYTNGSLFCPALYDLEESIHVLLCCLAFLLTLVRPTQPWLARRLPNDCFVDTGTRFAKLGGMLSNTSCAKWMNQALRVAIVLLYSSLYFNKISNKEKQ